MSKAISDALKILASELRIESVRAMERGIDADDAYQDGLSDGLDMAEQKLWGLITEAELRVAEERRASQ